MKYKLCPVLLFILIASVPCNADLVGWFDGLDNLIARSDAILIARIDEHININLDPASTTTHYCYVFKTLKGDVPAGIKVPLRLKDTTLSFREKFRLYSVHVVFLIKQPMEKDGIEYRSVSYEGANIEISPLFNEGMLKGNSIKERIKLLIQDYIQYRNQEIKREDVLFDKILKS